MRLGHVKKYTHENAVAEGLKKAIYYRKEDRGMNESMTDTTNNQIGFKQSNVYAEVDAV